MYPETRGGYLAVAMVLATMFTGCAKSPTRPSATDIRFLLNIQPRAGGLKEPISIVIRAVNAGNTRVLRWEGCGCGAIYFGIMGPDGAPVALYPRSSSPPPLCPCGPVPFEPNTEVEVGGRFTGVLYDGASPSQAYAAPPGTYTVVARFMYRTSIEGESIQLERTATFVWDP